MWLKIGTSALSSALPLGIRVSLSYKGQVGWPEGACQVVLLLLVSAMRQLQWNGVTPFPGQGTYG